MKMIIIHKLLILMILITVCVNPSACSAWENFVKFLGYLKWAGKMFKTGREVSTFVDHVVHWFPKTSSRRLTDLMADVDRLNNQIQDLENHIVNKLQETRILVEKAPILTQMYALKYDVNTIVERIAKFYELYLWASNETMKVNNRTLQNLASEILSFATNGLEPSLIALYDTTVGERLGERNLLKFLLWYPESEKYSLCNTGQSAQIMIFNIFTLLMMVEHIGISMTFFAVDFNRNSTGGPIDVDFLEKYVNDMNTRVSVYTEQFHGALNASSRGIRRCDPMRHIRDETFHEFESFIQGTIGNEADMDGGGSCSPYCPSVWMENCDHHRCNVAVLGPRKCNGFISDCQDLGGAIEYCGDYHLDAHPQHRRYRWLTTTGYGDFGVMNSVGRCDHTDLSGTGDMYKIETAQARSVMTASCFWCKCTCYQDSKDGVRYGFSTSLVASNNSLNMVIIGVRLTQRKNIIYIQIKQGKLLPYGVIQPPDNDEWLPLPPENSVSDKNVVYINSQHNRMNLNNAILQNGYALIGIGFTDKQSVTDEARNERIRLVIGGAKFDVETGIICSDTDVDFAGYGKDHTTEISVKNLKSPLAADEEPTERPGDDFFITFHHTDWKSDMAQTTIPLFDAQPIYATPYQVLGGVGLMYRSTQPDYAGFVGLKIYLLDLAPIMEFMNKTTKYIPDFQ